MLWINGGRWRDDTFKAVTCSALDETNGTLYVGFSDGCVSAFNARVCGCTNRPCTRVA